MPGRLTWMRSTCIRRPFLGNYCINGESTRDEPDAIAHFTNGQYEISQTLIRCPRRTKRQISSCSAGAIVDMLAGNAWIQSSIWRGRGEEGFGDTRSVTLPSIVGITMPALASLSCQPEIQTEVLSRSIALHILPRIFAYGQVMHACSTRGGFSAF